MELHVACLEPGAKRRRDFPYQGVQFHLLPAPRRGRALLLFARDANLFRPIFDELIPDVIHGWGTEDSFGLVARQLAPKRHVIGIQGLIKEYRQKVNLGPRSVLTEWTERRTLWGARNVVAESAYSARIAQPLCPNAIIRIVEHPLRREFLTHPPSEGTAPEALFVGAVNERKGINDALRAFAASSNGEWSLRVIGSGPVGNEAEMWRLAKDLGVRLSHHPQLSAMEVAAYMARSAVFLLPTAIDTGPTALKEALAMGLWPVCYDNSGPSEYLRKFHFGSLARDRDLRDLKETLRRDLTERPWLDLARRTALRKQTQEAFSRESVWRDLVAIYQQVIDRS
jgi:glycosyltransferase involved in cell wall biosynthesis